MGVGAGGYGYGLEGANQVNGVALVEEAEEALEVFVVEPVVDIFFKIKAEFGFGEMHLEGGFGADFGDLAEAEIAGGEEVCGEVRCNDFGAGGPNGEDRGLFGKVPPLFDDVVDVEFADAGNTGGGAGGEPFAVGTALNFVFGGDGDTQGSVADDEGGIGVGEYGGRVGIGFEKFGGDLPAARGEDLDERLGAAGAAVEGDAAGLADGHFADEQQAAHALLGGDGEAGEDGEAGNAGRRRIARGR